MGNPLTTPHTARRSFLATRKTLKSVYFAVISACLVLIPLDLASQCNLTPGSIKGDVFKDVNYNGVYDVSESGYTQAEILTYRSDGILHSTVIPDSDGRYRVDGLADGESYRVQIVLSSHLQSSVIGPDHQTNVRFVQSPACDINFGAANPIDFCDSDNPNVAVTCFVRGGPGVNESMETVVLTPYKFQEGSAINKIAMKGQTGSVFGTAWQSSTQTLFTSAFVKQDAFLKDGPGAVYRSFMSNGSYTTELWFDLSQLGVDFGQMAVANAENCNYGNQVGKVGIGGIEISDDEKYLYVVNLYAKSLVIVDLLDTQPGTTMEIPLPDPGCNGGEFRPFTVKSYEGQLYLSATCDASSSMAKADHTISVYTMDLETKMFDKVFSTSFTKDHWLDTPADHKKVSHWLTDIEFTKEGNMLLGIADRQSHRFCHSRLGLSNQYPDLLMVWNDNGVWKLENNGKAGSLTGSGAGNGQGPGGGEFFGNEHWILGPLYHPEIATGSIYVLPGSDEVVSTVFDPIYATFSGGLHRYSTTNGAKNGVIELYRNNDSQVFGKGSGLGNVIDMCAPAPIQIGNFVWIDEDEDGIQDAGELPVSDLELSLVNENCEVIAKTFTGPNGEYYFTETVAYHSKYYVVVSDGRYDGSSETISLNGSDYYLTLANGGMSMVDDGADNDAEIISGSSCDVINGKFVVAVLTSGPGFVNHTFDIGLSPKPTVMPTPDTFDLALMKAVNTSKPVKRGEIVDFEITIFNQGSISATDIEVTDYMPSGFAFAGILNPGWALQNGMPTYTFTNELKPGTSTTLTLSLQVQSTADAGGYINYSEISSAKDLAGNDRMDIDSYPDRINGNDRGGEPDGITDNEYQDNGTLDEDDHDPALVKIFDLALIKTTSFNQTIKIGDEVLFTISLINQGQISASTVEVVDYLPLGLSLSPNDNNGWTQNGLKLRNQYNGELKPGETVTLEVLLSVNDQAKPGAMINYAEIVSARDMSGKDLTPYDFDSTGDDDVSNDTGGEPDSATDDEYEDDGTIDEDDHDPAMLKIFDLALMKTVAQSNVESVDEDIDYTFTIYNQGDVAAKNIEVVDYLPDGFEFDGASNLQWQQVTDNLLRAFITSSLVPGQSVDLKLTLRLKSEALGKQLVNVGEISAAQNKDGSISRDFDSTPDRDAKNDIGGEINATTDNLITDDGTIDEDDHDPAVISSVVASVIDASLDKTVSVSHAASGESVLFELTVTNEEATALGRVRIVDYLPFFLENVDPEWRRSTNGLYVYRDLTIGDGLPAGGLEMGESASVTLETRVIEGTPAGMILNSAEISFMADIDQISLGDDLDSHADDDPNNDRSDNPNEVLGGAGAGSRPIEDDRAAADIVVSTIELQDSCTCENNESNGFDGQFSETIVVTSASGENWFVQEANNFYRSTSPDPPLAPIDMTGDALVETVLGGGLSIYTITGRFTQGTAWYAVVRNNFDALHSIESGQECRYTRPYIVGVNSVCVGGQEEYEVLSPTPGATYNWTLSDGGSFLTGTSGPKVKIQWDAVTGGPYTLMVNEDNPDNCTAPYSLEVEVGDQFVYSMSCIQETQVSLGPDCETVVTSAMLLTGGPYDYSAFTVILADEHGHPIPNATLTNEHIGKSVMATVLNSCTGNSCWAWLNVEDKLGPVITCFNDTVSCTSMGQYPYPVAIDACDANPTITLLDELVQPINCDSQFIKRIIRKYIAEDQWGNKSDTCTQEIMLTRIVVDDIQYPDTFSIATGNPLICKSFPADSLGRPLPEYTGIPMFGDVRLWPEDFYCNIAVDYRDIELGQIGCVRKIVREWRVLEWWCDRGFEMITYPQYIEITDTVAPKAVCPDVHYVVTNTRSCDADVQIDLPEITDLCSQNFRIDLVYPGGFIEDFTGGVITLPVDTNLIRFRVYDDCHNVDSCDFEIIVEDNTPPVAICDQFTSVGLTDTGLAYIYAETFDDGSYDNCTLKKMEVKRMDDGANCGLSAGNFGEYVDFCCEDIGQNVMVLFQVTDKAGNTNTCMVEVEVQDKIPPVFYYCPPTDTINCHYHFDTSDLSAFGEPIVLDNCEFDLRERVVVILDQCREGYIERIWVAEDNNNIATCVQRIHIINDAPFDSTDIIWPRDLDTNECREGFLTPDLLPERYAYPIVNEDACDLVGISFTDQTFPFVDNTEACYKILRKWKIINWCRFDSSVYDTWTHEQVIKVTNEVPPVITSDCSKIEKCIYDSCDFGYIELFATATDDCTDDAELRWEYHIDLHNDGIVDYSNAGIGDRVDVAREFDLGEHNVRWVFEDGCGNKTVCTQFFDLMNCKGPNAYCKNGIVVDLIAMDLDGDGECDTEMIEIWASDLDDNSTHPCDYPLTYSIGRDTSIKSVTYDCNDLGRREIEICVTDNKGFQSCCNTFVIVQDNNNDDCCPKTFDKDCVIGPADVNLTDCMSSTDPFDLMSFPITTNCDVDSIVTSFMDEDGTNGDNCLKIKRTWTVELYLGGLDTVCTYTHCITIDNEFTEDSIIWPQDTLIFDDCDISLDTVDTGGVPVLRGEYCDYVTLSYVDVEQEEQDPACQSYIRTWTVTNGCDNDKTYTFDQFIRFLNQAPPILIAPGDITVDAAPGLCVAVVSLPLISLGSCNTVVVVRNDHGNGGSDASGVYPVGETTVTFTAEDACGNIARAVTIVTVVDNQPPSLTCPSDMTFDCSVDIDDIDFGNILATDNCVDVALVIDTIYSLNDCDIGTITRMVSATDNAGNVARCQQVITIENQNPFAEVNITWPMDTVQINVCDSTLPEVTGMPMIDTAGISCFDITITYMDTAFMTDCDGAPCTIIERTWTVTDSCQLDGMGAGQFTFDQVIIIDGESLTLTCPADTMISCDVGLGDLSLYGTFSAVSECGIVSETLDTVYNLNTCDVGTVVRTYTVIDSAGMMMTCSQTITVENDNPFSVDRITWPMDSAKIGCDSMEMLEEPVIDTSGLTCFDIVITMNDSMYVDTCDGEPCDITMRKWTVMDSCLMDGMGGGIFCDTQIIVIDGGILSVSCPPDTLLSCEDVLGDLEDYGSLTFTSPCGLDTVILDTTYNLNACSLGTVVRSILVRDTTGNEVSCSQTITIGTDNPFDEGDITWPEDTLMLDNCVSSHPDSLMSRPMIDSSALVCARLSITYADSSVSSCEQTPCEVVYREWSVVDSCQLDSLGSGIFTFEQVIEVTDTTAPTFEKAICDTTFYASLTSCDFRVDSFTVTVDDCSPNVIITNDSPHADSSGADASGLYPLGVTEFFFFAEDGCCNKDSILARVTVIDTISPRITCTKVFRTMFDSIEGVKFFARDPVIGGNDNCTVETDFKFSFDKFDMNDTCRFYNCDSLRMTGLPNLLYFETVYVWDEAGNIDSCDALLQVVDMSGCFTTSGNVVVTGILLTENNTQVGDAQIDLTGSGNQTVMTNKNGVYGFNSMPTGGNYEVTPIKDDDHMNGVTTKDLVYIQRHLLGKQALTTPYQLISADINSSGSISAADLVDLRRMLLGYYSEFPSNSSWRFVRDDYVFPDPLDPWTEPWPEIYEIRPLVTSMYINFMGMKIGDVSGDVEFDNGENKLRVEETMQIEVSEIDGYYEFRKVSQEAIHGFQFTLNWLPGDSDFELLINGLTELSEDDFGFHSLDLGILTIASDDLIPAGEMVLFRIPVGVIGGDLHLDGSVTRDLAYNELFEMREVVLLSQNVNDGYVLHQNKPNPFTESTIIGFELPESQEARLSIWTTNGQVVYTVENLFQRGYNEVEVNKDLLKGSGIYYYRLDCNGYSQILKMINID